MINVSDTWMLCDKHFQIPGRYAINVSDTWTLCDKCFRYLDALRSNLREKMSKQGLELPSLCCCGETLWDTHPDTCANNCFYYKNHRGMRAISEPVWPSGKALGW